jgi:hypothetical protein
MRCLAVAAAKATCGVLHRSKRSDHTKIEQSLEWLSFHMLHVVQMIFSNQGISPLEALHCVDI